MYKKRDMCSRGEQQQCMQVEARAADLGQQVQRLQAEVDRLHSELNRERSSKEQHTSRFSLLEKQLQDKSSSLVTFHYNGSSDDLTAQQGSGAAQQGSYASHMQGMIEGYDGHILCAFCLEAPTWAA